MLLVDEIAQIIRINDKNIGAAQTAELIIDLLNKEGYGKMVSLCKDYENGNCKKNNNYCAEGDCIYWDNTFESIKKS